jgi:hypothetical protein
MATVARGAWANLRAESKNHPYLLAVKMLALASAPVLAGFASVVEGAWKALFFGMAAVAALAVFAVDLIRHSSSADLVTALQEDLVNAAVVAKVRMNEGLAPISEDMAMLATTWGRERDGHLGSFSQAICSTGSSLSSPDRARCTWFQFQGDGSLAAAKTAGRGRKPTTVFRSGRPDHEAIMKIAKGGGHQYFRDVLAKPPPGFDRKRTRDYRTFLGVPVVAGSRCYGWLTVDSPEPDDLNDTDDLGLLEVLASLLAAAHAFCEPLEAEDTPRHEG